MIKSFLLIADVSRAFSDCHRSFGCWAALLTTHWSQEQWYVSLRSW